MIECVRNLITRCLPVPWIAVMGLLAIAAARPALAQGPEQQAGQVDEASKARAKRAFAKGIAAYQLEKYDQAVQHFEEGYQAVPQAVFLYNIAQAYRLGHEPRLALDYYQRYLKQDPAAQNREEVEGRIAALREQLGDTVEPADKQKAEGPQGPAVAPPPSEPPPAPLLLTRSDDDRARRKRRLWLIIGGTVGGTVVLGLAVGLGVYFGTATNNPPVWQPVTP